jgi:hypothetical protein
MRDAFVIIKKSLGKMMKGASASEPFHKESKIEERSRHSWHEGLRRRRQSGTTATGETILHHKPPKIPPSIHRVDTVQPNKKQRRRRLPFLFKGFGSSSRKQQTPPPTRTASAARPSKKETPPGEVYLNPTLETHPDDSYSDYDHEFSSSEASSILSGFEEIEQVGSDYHGWERLERKLEIREETLKRLSEGKSEAYVKMLRHHEEAAKQQKIKEHGRKLTEKGSPRGSQTKKMDASIATSESLPTDTGLLGEVRRFLLFEGYHSGQAVAVILFSSVVGIAIYDMMDNMMRQIAGLSAPYVNIHQFHALLIVFGAVVMRTTGYIWWWLQGDSFACVKFELHNRHKLGHWDARLMHYLSRSGKTLANCLNIICFYSLYIGISYFYYLAMDMLLWDTLVAWFKLIAKEAASALEAVSGLPVENVSPEPNLCDGAIQTLVSNPISRFVGSRLCMTEDWDEFALAFNIVVISVAAVVYYNLVGSSLVPFLI